VFLIIKMRPFEKRKDFLVTFFFITKSLSLFPRYCESLSSRHCEFLPSRHCEERSDEAISPIAPPRNCEPKGRRVFWREAISSLHVLVGVRCSGGIASPDCYQARNDAMGLFARNDGVGLQARNDAPFVIARAQPEAISSLHLAFLFTKTLYLPDAKFLSPRV